MRRAIIEFDPGYRTQPPKDRYVAPILFGEDGGLWSLVCEKRGQLDDEGWIWIADVEFLAPRAPHDKLVTGFEFELIEGAHVSAKGRIE